MAKKFDAKAKAKRQKIIAAVLGVLLLGVLAYEVPSLMKTMNKKPPAASSATTTATPAPVVPGATPPAGTPVAAAAPTAALTDSDPAPQAGSGQLLSFDTFETKDPFVQQVDNDTCTTDCPAEPTKSAEAPKAAKPAKETPATPPSSKQPAGTPTGARISVNGTAELVDLSGTFPAADPVFRLVGLTATTAKVAVAGGSLSSGDSTVTLKKGKKLTLMNTADGTRYVLVLVSTF
jgi:hypothetical protein